LLIADRVIVSNNYDVTNVTIKLFNDGIHNTVFNGMTITKQTITKYKVDFKIMMQKDENDKKN
jgi:hypothetical protein